MDARQRKVTVVPPSFPQAPADQPLTPARPDEVWQVLCGDEGHWRAGVFSPAATRADELAELERHDCPELFLLLGGALTLVVADGAGGALREIPLAPGRPVLVEAPHGGYCPGGPHSGQAFVVERDRFTTTYRSTTCWLADRGDEG